MMSIGFEDLCVNLFINAAFYKLFLTYCGNGCRLSKSKGRAFRNIEREVERMILNWGKTSIKALDYPQFEDFLYSFAVSDKTRSNIRSVINDLFTWISRRKKIPMPEVPKIEFELGWRNIIDIDLQQTIISKIHEIR